MEGRFILFNTMNTIRPRPYPQRETGNYNAGSDSTDKDGHNSNAQDQQQQQRQHQQTVARGRVEDIQQQAPNRQAIYSPAANAYPSAYPQRQTYKVNTPPPIRYNNHVYHGGDKDTVNSSSQDLKEPDNATNENVSNNDHTVKTPENLQQDEDIKEIMNQ